MDVDISQISEATREFSLHFRDSFEGAPTYEKREMLKQAVRKVEVDADQKSVCCYIRRFPFANRGVEMLLGELERAKLATDHQLQVRIDEVPGTPRTNRSGLRPRRSGSAAGSSTKTGRPARLMGDYWAGGDFVAGGGRLNPALTPCGIPLQSGGMQRAHFVPPEAGLSL